MLKTGVREAPKRNLKGFLPLRRTGDVPGVARRRRRPSGFALPGSLELVLILGAPRTPAAHPSAPWICSLPDLDISSIS